MTKIDVLVWTKVSQAWLDYLAETYEVHYRPDQKSHSRLLQDPLLKRIRAVQTKGSYGLSRPFFDAMPNLEIVCSQGAGFERIDLAAARERRIVVTHCVGTNSATVADHAFALLLAVMRRIPLNDRGVRERRWRELQGPLPALSERKMGIFGLGEIGLRIARRAAGFDLKVGYHNRKPREDVGYRYFSNLEDMAAWCDVLMISAPGGAETYHVVENAILNALGPRGFLVNTARGSLVDTTALVAALTENRIAGAALDVVEGEPEIPDALLGLDNLVLTPHLGAQSTDAALASVKQVRANLDAHFKGEPVLTPVPGLFD
ncbi:MAG: 2-hydroxyacid dehydrogenase [Rhodospirillales bacterium]